MTVTAAWSGNQGCHHRCSGGYVDQAKKKLESMSNVALYIGDVTALPPAILQNIQNRWGFSTFSLLTAQRVLLNIKKNRRVKVLRH